MSYDLTGQKFGHLTVIRQVPNPSKTHKERMYECECDCADRTHTVVRSDHLRSGRVVSCGCKRRTHKRDATAELIISRFKGMKARCLNPNEPGYPHYGGRGITICEQWLKNPELFVKWSKETGFDPSLSIDRIDNNGPYSPENCRWVDMTVQTNNRRVNHFVEVDGVKQTVTQWEHQLNLKRSTLYNLIAHEGEDAVAPFIRRKLNGGE